MFKPKTIRLTELATKYPDVIEKLNTAFSGITNVYIDYANVIHWHRQLGWHVDIKRLKQLLDSFSTIKLTHFYAGTLMEEQEVSEHPEDPPCLLPVLSPVELAAKYKYLVHTKPVKVIKLSVDVSGIPENSPAVLQNFIDKQFLSKINLETVAYLNKYLKVLNTQGLLYIEKRKCNFDVEIGIDVLIDHKMNGIDTFALWSGDSDFAGPLKQLMDDGRKVIVFSTTRRISHELKQLSNEGMFIFDIQRIKEFVCFSREMQKGSQ